MFLGFVCTFDCHTQYFASYLKGRKLSRTLAEHETNSLLFCQIQEAVNMAASAFWLHSSIESVFSFWDNTDYGRVPRVSEAPSQRVTHFRSLLYFNQTTTRPCTGHFKKNSRVFVFDLWPLHLGIFRPSFHSRFHLIARGNSEHGEQLNSCLSACECSAGRQWNSGQLSLHFRLDRKWYFRYCCSTVCTPKE